MHFRTSEFNFSNDVWGKHFLCNLKDYSVRRIPFLAKRDIKCAHKKVLKTNFCSLEIDVFSEIVYISYRFLIDEHILLK